MMRIIENDGFSGTSPTSIIGGNAYILLGYSSVSPSDVLDYGVQIAISFSSSKIAIRNAPYNSQGGTTWSQWKAISPT